MRLGYTTWGMQTVPAEDAIPMLAEIGYDAVEIAVVPGWRDELDALTPARRRRIKELLAQHNLALPALAGHRSLVAEDPAQHAENWRRLQATIDLAVEWAGPAGPPVLDTTAGGKAGEWDVVKNRLVDRLGRLCDYAAERGVTVAIEPGTSSALNTPDTALALLRLVGRPNLKVTFDVSNFDVQGIPLEESVAKLAGVAVLAHVKDERGVAPNHEFLIPGEGELDYVRYLRAMEQVCYSVDVCIEISLMVQRRPGFDPREAAERAYAVVAPAFDRAGVKRSR